VRSTKYKLLNISIITIQYKYYMHHLLFISLITYYLNLISQIVEFLLHIYFTYLFFTCTILMEYDETLEIMGQAELLVIIIYW